MLSRRWRLLLLLPACLPLSRAQGQDADPVLTRQLIMQELDKDSEALGQIAAGTLPPDTMAQHAQRIAKDAKEAYEAFKPNVPGGGAKPAVWSDWDDFSKRMEAFITGSDKLAQASASGSVAAMTDRLIDGLPCKECHDIYRQKKASKTNPDAQ